MTGNITDLGSKRAERDRAKDTIRSFASHFSDDARKARFRQMLLNLIDEHKDLGAEFLIGELSGGLVTVQAMKE